MRALLAHPGTQYAHRLASQLYRNNLLGAFATGLAFTPSSRFLKLLPDKSKRSLSNRIISDLPKHFIKRIPAPEVISLIKIWAGNKSEDVFFNRNKEFQQRVIDRFLSEAEACIGFDTSSWLLAEAARQKRIPFILDQSIGHPRSKTDVYNSLIRRYPDWAEAVPLKKSHFLSLEDDEQNLATRIIVASTFTKKTLVENGVDEGKIIINPYGVGEQFFRPKDKPSTRRKVRFLFVGMMSARKGLPILLEMWSKHELWKLAELWVAGPGSSFAVTAASSVRGVIYKGKIPFVEMPALINECDCLIFPSFFEGFGQVILEAMASGLPVITTNATAGPDIIENMKDGVVYDAQNADELLQAMTNFAEAPTMVYEMGVAARSKAREFSWEAYGDRWKLLLTSI